MLDIKAIRENPELIKDAFKKRGMDIDILEIIALDENKRKIISEADALRHEKNVVSDKIGKLKSEGKDAEDMIKNMKVVSEKLKKINEDVEEIENKLYDILIKIPNIPHESVPVGLTEESNEFIRDWGKKKEFNFKALSHVELSEKMGIIDFSGGSKITGSNFILYKGSAACLERALINFMIDFHVKKHGYTEVSVPFIVNRNSMFNTGQLPKLEEDMYRIESEDYFLIPTAEVPVTNIHKNDILEESCLPVKYVAYTPCFRKEAGSYGKDTKGLIRIHQFDKVEMVNFTKPEDSYNRLEGLVNEAEEILQVLDLHYRIVALASGDISFAAAKCYDLEVWAPGLERFLEVSSCSNFEDFQARRGNIKFRNKDSNLELVHTLNGSGLALPRAVIAIMENYQQEDGSIKIPEVLKPYLGVDKINTV